MESSGGDERLKGQVQQPGRPRRAAVSSSARPGRSDSSRPPRPAAAAAMVRGDQGRLCAPPCSGSGSGSGSGSTRF